VFDGGMALKGAYGTADTFDGMPAPLPDMDAAKIAARERRAGLFAGAALAVVALAVMVFALSALAGAPAGGTRAAAPVVSSPPRPAPGPAARADRDGTPPAASDTSRASASAGPAPVSPDGLDRIPMTAHSATLFMPLYRRAAQAFGVNWRLIASIHQQETSFSSAPGTYHGLNFARCCAGPMQFNVTNGPVTTWERFRNAYRRADRPASYPHRTRRHPSVYDDFDAIMAAGALLRANGAGPSLDGSAWLASYHYYGHDFTGLQYADNVLARAVGWSRSGLCVRCGVDAQLAARFDAAFAAPFRAELLAAERRARAAARAKAREREQAKRAAREQARRARAARQRAAKLEAERRARAREKAARKAAEPAAGKASASGGTAESASAAQSGATSRSSRIGVPRKSDSRTPPSGR
jgi:hypothetical protein